MFDALPLEIRRRIYEYDPTYHDVFESVMVELKTTRVEKLASRLFLFLYLEGKQIPSDVQYHSRTFRYFVNDVPTWFTVEMVESEIKPIVTYRVHNERTGSWWDMSLCLL